MPIGNAVEKGSSIFVYDEKGRQLFIKSKGLRPGDGLKSFTGSMVNIRQGNMIVGYNEKGSQISIISAS